MTEIKQSKQIENIDEGMKTAITLSLLAALFSIPGVINAKEIEQNSKDQAKLQKVFNDQAAIDMNIIARTLFYEARGEKDEGLKAVASVIYNRAGGDKTKFRQKCLKYKQFSCWNETSADKKSKVIVPKEAVTDAKVWETCKKLASEMYNGTFKSTIGTRNCYYAQNTVVPKWASSMKDKFVLKNHTFGYLPEHDGFRGKKNIKTKASLSSQSKIQGQTKYTVKAGDNGLSIIAQNLIKAKKTNFKKISELIAAIVSANPNLKKDKHGNPIIRVGQVLIIPEKQ